MNVVLQHLHWSSKGYQNQEDNKNGKEMEKASLQHLHTIIPGVYIVT